MVINISCQWILLIRQKIKTSIFSLIKIDAKCDAADKVLALGKKYSTSKFNM